MFIWTVILLFLCKIIIQSALGREEVTLDLRTFRQQNLLCHNKYREKHGVHPLTYNEKLNKEALTYAKRLASSDSFNIKINVTYGISLYRMKEDTADGYVPCDDWYNENEKYDYSKRHPDNFNEIGHFTQMVSRASCFMGAGIANSKSGRLYIAIFYYPHGNIINEYHRNIYPADTNRHKTTRVEAMMRNIACTDSTRETYLQQNLECHNVVREKYKVGPLAYNDKLNKLALEKAQLFARRDIDMSDSGNKPVEDYLLTSVDGIIDGYNYCQQYYEDGQWISFDTLYKMDENGDIDNAVLGFPQMIWKSTRYMGFGMARSKNGTVYSVAVYDPIGNVIGQFRRNIFEPSDKNIEWLSPDPDSWERF